MTTSTQPRRTQQERREQTIARLLDATIECLVHDGYSGTTVKAVADRAGLSQGAIFRHFPTRLDLLMATMNTVADRFISGYEARVERLRRDDNDDVRVALQALQSITTTNEQTAWFEIQLAARTDEQLRDAFRPIFLRNQKENFDTARTLFPDTIGQLPMMDELIQLLIHVFHGQSLDAHLDSDEQRHQQMMAVTTQVGQLGFQLLAQLTSKPAQ